jgi:hypothetical protein
MFFNLAQVVGLQSFIDPNPNDASAFWGAKHIPISQQKNVPWPKKICIVERRRNKKDR